MITPAYLSSMALYNRWQNERLYELCAAMSDDERKRDRGMFFHTIHKSLDYLVYVDQATLQMVRLGQRPELDLKTLLYPDFLMMRAAREDLDDELVRLAGKYDVHWLGQKAHPEFRFTRGFQLVQLFNHQTHHRSQITSELHKLGIDCGSTDLRDNPYLRDP